MAAGGASATTLVVVVPDHEVIEPEEGFGRRHAIYRIVCTEGAATWEVRRRWTELRITYDALQHTHAAALRGAPAFEAHPPFWRLGPGQLEPDFLDQRAKAMQDLLQALVDRLDVSIERQAGPSPLLALLTDCDDVHAAARAAAPGLLNRAQSAFPLRPAGGPQHAAVGMGTPADWRRAQSAAAMLGSPAEDAALAALAAEAAGERMAAPDLASELGDARDDPDDASSALGWSPALGSPASCAFGSPDSRAGLTPANPRHRARRPPEEEPKWLLEAGAYLHKTATGNFGLAGRGADADADDAAASPDTPDTVDAPMTPAAAEGDGAATMAAAAMAVAAAVGPLPASPANGASLPPSPPPASGSASSSASPPPASLPLDAAELEEFRQWQQQRRRAAAAATATTSAAAGAAAGAAASAPPSKAPRGNAAAGGGRRVPLWVLMALVAALVGRVVWVAAGFTPSAIRERIEAERRRHDPNRPIMGPRGLMYRVAPDDTAGGTPDAAEVSTPTPSVEAAAAAEEVEVEVEVGEEAPSGRETRQPMPRPLQAAAAASVASASASKTPPLTAEPPHTRRRPAGSAAAPLVWAAKGARVAVAVATWPIRTTTWPIHAPIRALLSKGRREAGGAQ